VEYTIEGEGNSRTIRATGPLKFGDHPIAPAISELFQLKAVNEIVLDLTDLEAIDSYGLGVLIKINQAADEAGKSFKVSGVRGRIRETFDIFKLDRQLTVI